MTQEKILFFLGLEKNQKIDKTTIRIAFWFDVIYTLVIIGCGLLFELFLITFANIIFISCLLLADIVFWLFLKRINNPVYAFSYLIVVYIVTSFKLIYGYFIFSKAELIKDGYPLFGGAHIIVLILLFVAGVYLYVNFYNIYQDLKYHTTEYIILKTNEKNQKSKFKWIAIALASCSPMLFVRLFDDDFKNMKLGIGFGFWCLACIWLWLACMYIPKYLVSQKYKVAEWFK